MKIPIKVKKFGDREWGNREIILPDFCEPYFEFYTLEIIEFHRADCMGIYFQTKEQPEVDIVSYTVYRPEIQKNIEDGFKSVFEKLSTIKTPKPRKTKKLDKETTSTITSGISA